MLQLEIVPHLWKMLSEEDASSLEDLLDSLEHISMRNDDQRAVLEGSGVRVNVYDMVCCG